MNSLALKPAVGAFLRHASKAAFIAAAAEDLAARLEEAVEFRGAAVMALAGGKTPEPVYAELGKRDLAWAKVTATLTDERFVPPTSPQSNAGLLARSLFAGPGCVCGFIPLWRDVASAAEAADLADQRLASLEAPFDVVVLGVGDDGHTASLFPHAPELVVGLNPAASRKVIAVAPGAPAPFEARLSLTLPAILNARAILVLAAGAEKRRVLEAALAGENANAMPIRAVLHQTRVPVVIHWSPEA
jgi:6-phosphogluconolactonase